MQKPNLDRLWQVWIKIGILPNSIEERLRRATSIIKAQVTETVSILETKEMIDWYYFLIHKKENDNNLYFHLLLSLKEGVNSEDFLMAIPSYCLEPKHLGREYGESISEITKTQLKNDEIEEAWKLIGEQSEWMIHLVNAHKDGEMAIKQVIQFMHFYMNMMGLGHLSKFPIPPFVYSF